MGKRSHVLKKIKEKDEKTRPQCPKILAAEKCTPENKEIKAATGP